MGRYGRAAIAAAIEKFWDNNERHEELHENGARFLYENGCSNFLEKYKDHRSAFLSQTQAEEIILKVLVRYNWLRDSLDGKAGYENLDVLAEHLVEMRKLSAELGHLGDKIEIPYLAGESILNFVALSKCMDSQGEIHLSSDTFFGVLVTRLIIDATAVFEGLSGLETRMQRSSGPPPVVSLNWLTMVAFDLYQGDLVQTKVDLPPVRNPKSGADFTGKFWEFLMDFTDLIAPEAAPNKRVNTGYGSTIPKLYRKFSQDRSLPGRLNPTADIAELVLVTNEIASPK